ncbi:Threonine kinase in B12 biosynthesis [Klebsiella pneumoniae IS39]|nr:Threonine kinase in B12 biosynthesis [Klebsiella pneumoniae IS39]
MVDQLLAHWGYPPALSQQIRITLHSTIPVAKGMASSTADIACHRRRHRPSSGPSTG